MCILVAQIYSFKPGMALPLAAYSGDYTPLASALTALAVVGLLWFLFMGPTMGLGLARLWLFQKGVANYNLSTLSNASVFLNRFSYYLQLSPAAKREFLTRTLNFLHGKTIEGAGDYEPDYPTQMHIAATATQITFGFPDFTFVHFDRIILYPGIFKLSENAPLMKGATTPDGIIRISVKDYDAGYANPSDKLNVGLHEFAHALFMELLKQAGQEDESVNAIYPYLTQADQLLHSGKDKDHFLRNYAFTNRHEFFAVSVEHFFEAPEEFSTKLPELFKVMRNLMRQDPRNVKADYAF